MWMIAKMFAILFPPRCLGCGKKETALCERCVLLARKSLSPPNEYTVSLFDFRDPLIRKAIHAIKYYRRKDLVLPLARELAKELAKKDLTSSILVPIPMTSWRTFVRGYNHATILACELGKILGVPVESGVLMRKYAPTQQATLKTKKERIKNQKGTFVAGPKARGRTCIIIDDVTTTGATLDEARGALLCEGAASVSAATLAH